MLPADKYQEWKVLDLPFTPQDSAGRDARTTGLLLHLQLKATNRVRHAAQLFHPHLAIAVQGCPAAIRIASVGDEEAGDSSGNRPVTSVHS